MLMCCQELGVGVLRRRRHELLKHWVGLYHPRIAHHHRHILLRDSHPHSQAHGSHSHNRVHCARTRIHAHCGIVVVVIQFDVPVHDFSKLHKGEEVSKVRRDPKSGIIPRWRSSLRFSSFPSSSLHRSYWSPHYHLSWCLSASSHRNSHSFYAPTSSP